MPSLLSVLTPPTESSQDVVDALQRDVDRLLRRRADLSAEKEGVEAEIAAKATKLAAASVDGDLKVDFPGNPRQQVRVLSCAATISEIDRVRLPAARAALAKAQQDHKDALQVGVDRDSEGVTVDTEDAVQRAGDLAATWEHCRSIHSGGLAVPTFTGDLEPLQRLVREIELHRGSSSGGQDCQTFADADAAKIRGYRARQNGEGKE